VVSRSNYSDDLDNWAMIKWRGAVLKATNGKRGQQLLKDLLAALDAMPEKRLIENELIEEDGAVCALGALGVARGLSDRMATLDPDDPEEVAQVFGVAPALVQEIEFENDEGDSYWPRETPEQRWTRMREWVATQVQP
jgi:hypothetical protein